ncbi:cardiolipin synthase [Caenimonas terrae]|uniref:Cardiolipin synthase n=1 Tax=Caenimonas terrae TaxID=696074 RepID=A0ABW0N7Y9_9BURK
MKVTKKVVLWFIAGLATALVLTLIVLNLSLGEKKIERQLARLFGSSDSQFQYEMGTLLGPPIIDGNRTQPLLNGDQIFPSMLQAIGSARRTITFESYIYWAGDIGKKFADALSERARNGVKVHVLLDWAGSQKVDPALLDEMKVAGVQLQRFHEPRWFALGRINNRTHRKLLVIDGRLGFTGGVGIAPQWEGHGQDSEHWRDTHFRIEGPVVAQMQSVFADNWTKASGAVLHGSAYYPPLSRIGDQRAHMFSSSPSGGAESMQLMYLMAITAADHSIDLASAYFVPNQLTRNAMVRALKRGVKIRVIVPGPFTDADTVSDASKANWDELLDAGAKIYEYQPTMYHCKVLILDGRMTSVGSTNFDQRSFSLNDEANLNVYDEAFAREQTRTFEDDLAKSREFTAADWHARPAWERLKERAANLLAPQL